MRDADGNVAAFSASTQPTHTRVSEIIGQAASDVQLDIGYPVSLVPE